MPTINAQDGTEIYYKDWGAGQPVVLSHGWPLLGRAAAGGARRRRPALSSGADRP